MLKTYATKSCVAEGPTLGGTTGLTAFYTFVFSPEASDPLFYFEDGVAGDGGRDVQTPDPD